MLVLLLSWLLGIQQLSLAPQGGSLKITVLERGTGLPLADTSIWIRRSHEDGRTVHTGPDGVVTVEDLPAGAYIVDVTSDTHLRGGRIAHPGIAFTPEPPLDAAVDSHVPGEARVMVVPGGSQPIVFRLERGGVLSGHVVSAGRPLAGAVIEIVTMVDREVLGRPITSGSRRAISNTDGSFRFQGLYPDTYLVRAHPAHAGPPGFSAVYYPGTLDVRDAVPIVVGSGTFAEVLFNLEHVPAVRVSGRVFDSGHVGIKEIVVRRMDEDTGDVINLGILPLKPDGSWVWDSASSGVHALLYTRKASSGRQLLAAAWKVLYVDDQPLKDIDLQSLPAASMSGTFDFGAGPVPSNLEGSVYIFLRPEGVEESIRWGLPDQGYPGDGGAFRIHGIVGASTIDVNEPEGWIAEAVTLADGRDILDRNFAFEPGKHYAGVRVLLSSRVATVRGSVPREIDRTPGGLMVIAFPEEAALRKRQSHVKTGHVEDDGTFVVSNLRPGTSYLVTTCGWPCGAEYDGARLEELAAAATRVYVDKPGSFTVALKR